MNSRRRLMRRDPSRRMTRSEVMSRVRSRGTRLEARFRSIAGEAGFRVRRADRLQGKPDFRILGFPLLVFVNSCFWHGCPRHCRMPSSRKDYWQPKIQGNVRRQRRVVAQLRGMGYVVLVVWEHNLTKRPGAVVAHLRRGASMAKSRIRQSRRGASAPDALGWRPLRE